VLRATDGAATPSSNDVFASGLDQPFGIAFYPPGSDPQWIYVANTGSGWREAFFQALVNLLLGRRGIRHILPPPRLAPRNREFPPECAVNIVLPIKPPLLSDDPDTEIAI
jgi:hypothetical protein